MSSREFSEWLAFDNAYGLGDAYFITGQICAVIAAGLGGKRRSPADFVPFFKRQADGLARPIQSPEEGLARMRMVAAAFAAKQKREGLE